MARSLFSFDPQSMAALCAAAGAPGTSQASPNVREQITKAPGAPDTSRASPPPTSAAIKRDWPSPALDAPSDALTALRQSVARWEQALGCSICLADAEGLPMLGEECPAEINYAVELFRCHLPGQTALQQVHLKGDDQQYTMLSFGDLMIAVNDASIASADLERAAQEFHNILHRGEK